MKIQRITSEHGRDFRALMECEHCAATQEMRNGYHDAFFHDKVIPALCCNSCGKNRAGEVTGRKEHEHVPA